MPDAWIADYYGMALGMTQSVAFRDVADEFVMTHLDIPGEDADMEGPNISQSEEPSTVLTSSVSQVVDTTKAGVSKAELAAAKARLETEETKVRERELAEKREPKSPNPA